MLKQHPKITVPILMYHSISNEATKRFRPFVVPPALFARHMYYLYKYLYTPISVTQLAKLLFAGRAGSIVLPERPVVITFDDGFADFFSEALPILARYEFTATLYIATAFINRTSRWLRREGETERPMLTWNQIAIVSAQGIEIGAHSHHHFQLDTLPQALAREEIVQSKRILEDHLGRAIESFAYPFGYSSPIVRQLVRQAGFTSACAVKHRLSSELSDPFALARLMIDADTGLKAFGTLLNIGRSTSLLTTMYRRVRTPIWQSARRGSAVLTRHFQEEQAIL
jgi:peptidoglycan/xylan/chitin deacetylase (PgdA/CDA1 family)